VAGLPRNALRQAVTISDRAVVWISGKHSLRRPAMEVPQPDEISTSALWLLAPCDVSTTIRAARQLCLRARSRDVNLISIPKKNRHGLT